MGYAPFAPKPKTPPLPKKDKPAKNAICHQCGKVGHWKRNCPVYFVELMKKKKLSQGASTSGLRGSKKLKSGALSLYVGDDHCATNAKFFESKLLDLKASRSVEDLELIQEEDTNPSVDTSLNHEEDD
nr:zinc finger, CCHC-type [Tanacetum cinerariifolium]